MKKSVRRLTEEALKDYPIRHLVNGWYFRQHEVSQGCFIVEGTDCWGRQVSFTGTEDKLKELLAECVKAARAIMQATTSDNG